MSIRIVTHCWAEKLPQYADLLRYQLGSLCIHPPTVKTTCCVVYVRGDRETEKVLSYFDNHPRYAHMWKLETIPVARDLIFPRAYGRNAGALISKEDVVWFTDVDHYFGFGCLDHIDLCWQTWFDGVTVMAYPETIQIHKDHATGDELISRAQETNGLVYVNPDDFAPKRYTVAVGGVMICDGNWVRAHGYLRDTGWVNRYLGEPYDRGSRDDRAFRKQVRKSGDIERVSAIPNLYRIRHSQTTRRLQDVDVASENPEEG